MDEEDQSVSSVSLISALAIFAMEKPEKRRQTLVRQSPYIALTVPSTILMVEFIFMITW